MTIETTPIPPKEINRVLLTDEFAAQVFGVSTEFAPDLPVPSLICWSEFKIETVRVSLTTERNNRIIFLRRYPTDHPDYEEKVAGIEELRLRIERLQALPQAPDSWGTLVDSLDTPHKKALIQAIGAELREGKGSSGHRWIDSDKAVEYLRRIEDSEEYIRSAYGSFRKKFLAKAF